MPARRLGGRAGGGAAGRPGAARRAATAWRPARPSTCRARSTACAASSRRPRRPTARRARPAASRSPAWRCCGWPRGMAPRPPRRSAGHSARPSTRPPARACCRRTSRSCSPRARRRRRARAAVELGAIAEGQEDGMLGAMAAFAAGAVALAAGDPGAALGSSRRAAQAWQRLEAPYETARARALVGLACRALGDEDTAAFELEAARGVFAGLGAAPELARVEALAAPATPDVPRADRARAGGAPARRRRSEQPRDRRGARAQRAHRRPPPAEHLRQARRLLAHRRERARVVRNDHAATTASW